MERKLFFSLCVYNDPGRLREHNELDASTVQRTKRAGVTLPDPSFFSAAFLFTALRRYRDQFHSGKVSCVVLYEPNSTSLASLRSAGTPSASTWRASSGIQSVSVA
ncbi:hypothetical protein EVAR_38419_1 [Eumeta japonica]|uniref:Uncharacterized protein n=1 Tax=Eumeta variegata TaxID=151549 RepID=A0A4C1WYT0_EUMVA|nr:hypothetical protein EVAR_38419_1 [Eumeta japonica]